MIHLRSYQRDILKQVESAINNHINPIVQLDTGAGKTPIIAELCRNIDNFIVIAHRNFLVRQASETLSKMRVDHDVLASKYTRNLSVVSALKHNSNLINSNNKLVASVDTILSKKKRLKLNFNLDENWVVIIDEAHHALDDNKWGLLKHVLPNAIFVGVTATPLRMDGRSLNSETGGLFDCIIQAEELKENSVRTLINNGYLSDFKCFINEIKNKHDYHFSGFQSHLTFEDKFILGEYTKSYSRLAKNKRAIVMCRSIKEAEIVAEQFRFAGFSAMCISSKMSQTEVTRAIDDFKIGVIKILCNVAMIDEGFDVPDAECLIMLRTTNYRTYKQWVGRVLRPKDSPAIIIDHAENLISHGLPDDNVNWSLFKENGYKSHLIDCIECGRVFHISKFKCPECGHELNEEEEEDRSSESNPARKVIIASLKRFKRLEEENRIIKKMQESHKHELQIPSIGGSDLISKTMREFAVWFCKSLKQYIDNKTIDFENINKFMIDNFNDKNFWITNFTAKDLRKQNESKCFEVYKKYGGK